MAERSSAGIWAVRGRPRRVAMLVPAVLAGTLALAALVGLVSAREGGTSDIVVTDAWAWPAIAAVGTPSGGQSPTDTMVGGSNSVVYLTITNRGDGRDKLVSVTVEGASAFEFHYSEIVDNVADMRRVASVDVPKRSEVRFGPIGYQLVLVRMQRDLRPGDVVTIVLNFERMGPVTVAAPVRKP